MIPVLLMLTGVAEAGTFDAPAVCPPGRETQLEIRALERPRFLMHDKSVGRDKLILRRTGPDAREIFSLELNDGRWTCLAIDRGEGRYVVGAFGEVGAWIVLRSVSYLRESAPKLQDSGFTRGNYMALASVASSDGRYLAFVGGEGNIDGLYVLDTRHDVVRRLGAPPAPPPVADFQSDERFDWGTGWAGGYLVLEPSVLRFEGTDVVIATYGRDTHKARAKKRVVRRFKL